MTKPYCGSNNPPSYISTGISADICFHSGNNDEFRKGFEIEYNCSSPATISPPTTTVEPSLSELFGPAGNISSPGWPNRYPNRTDFCWNITCEQDEVVSIDFIQLDLEFHSTCQ